MIPISCMTMDKYVTFLGRVSLPVKWRNVECSFMCWCTVRSNKPQILEQRKANCRSKQGEQVAHAQKTWWFSEKCFYRQNLEWGLQDMWLSSRLVGGVNGAVFQESCVQREVIVLRLGGGLCSCRRTDRHYVYSLGRNQYPVLIAALLFLNCFFFVSAFPYFSD